MIDINVVDYKTVNTECDYKSALCNAPDGCSSQTPRRIFRCRPRFGADDQSPLLAPWLRFSSAIHYGQAGFIALALSLLVSCMV